MLVISPTTPAFVKFRILSEILYLLTTLCENISELCNKDLAAGVV